MLSVIVPIYNVEQYLPQCIESICNQRYKELEILLIDDGSMDHCPEICEYYALIDNRIRVFHKKNEGLVKARKIGLSEARGDYIAFVDGDDWIDKNMYFELMEAIKKSDADFIDSSFFCDRDDSFSIEKKSKGLFELDLYTKHRFFQSLLGADDFTSVSPSIWSKVFRADIIKKSYDKVPDYMQYGEDVICLLYCILNSDKMFQVENAFYHYIFREDSMSHQKSISYIRKEFVLWNYCGKILLDNDEFMTQEMIDDFLFQRLYLLFNYLIAHDFDVIQYYAFPHIELLYGKKVVIYGAGRVGKDFVTQISKYEKCNIVCWVDKNYKKLDVKYREIVALEQIFDKSYDYILIAVAQKTVAYEIKQLLLKNGISKEKILWYEPYTFF